MSTKNNDLGPVAQNLPLMVTLPSMITTMEVGNLDFDWLLIPVSTMVVAIDGKVTINGKFYATCRPQKHFASIEIDVVIHLLSTM